MENQNNQSQQFRCTGDCFKCQPLQRQYCAAQWSYNSMRMIETMQDMLKVMQGTVEELKGKIEAIQGNESSLFDPMQGDGQIEQPTEYETETMPETEIAQ